LDVGFLAEDLALRGKPVVEIRPVFVPSLAETLVRASFDLSSDCCVVS
jgi:hypothetical protein